MNEKPRSGAAEGKLRPPFSMHRLPAIDWLSSRGVGPGIVFALALFAYVVVPGVWAYRDGNLVTHDGVDAFLTTRTSYVFAIPVVFAGIFAYFQSTTDVVARLVASATLAGDEDAFEQIVTNVHQSLGSRLMAAFVAVSAMALPILFLLNSAHPTEVTWLFSNPHHPRPVAFFFAPAVHGGAIFVFGTWVLHHLRASFVLRRVMDQREGFAVRLTILHPDGCMGLGPVGDMVRSVSTVLIALGLVLFTWQAGSFYSNVVSRNDPSPLVTLFRDLAELQAGKAPTQTLPVVGVVLAWAAFGICAPLVFFLPLKSAKQAMQSLRTRTLNDLSRRVAREQGALDDKDLVRKYLEVHQARVWPFNVKTIATFVLTLASPIALTVLTEIAKRTLFSTP